MCRLPSGLLFIHSLFLLLFSLSCIQLSANTQTLGFQTNPSRFSWAGGGLQGAPRSPFHHHLRGRVCMCLCICAPTCLCVNRCAHLCRHAYGVSASPGGRLFALLVLSPTQILPTPIPIPPISGNGAVGSLSLWLQEETLQRAGGRCTESHPPPSRCCLFLKLCECYSAVISLDPAPSPQVLGGWSQDFAGNPSQHNPADWVSALGFGVY